MGRLFVYILLLLLAPEPPNLTAYWDGPGAAVITWTQSTRSCLYVIHQTGETAFIECREKAGTHTVYLGGAGTDGHVRPVFGDWYVLSDATGELARTPLVGRSVYVAVIRA